MLNRKLQNELLQLSAFCYPAFCHYKINEIYDFNNKYPIISSASRDELWREVNYLKDHGLLTLDSQCSIRSDLGNFCIYGFIKATVKGMDFIFDDGGLSAILNVQTIKFHRDAVVVLEDLIAISNMNEAEKEKAKSTLGELSTEALKTVVQTATTALLAL